MIKITNLNKYFYHRKNNEIHVINNTSFEFPKTGLVTIIGESGSGKSTSLRNFKNDEVATLKAHCDLWRGATIDTDNVTYAWGIKDSAVFANTTLSAAANSGATTITVASIANMEAGGKITIGSAQYTISSVNTSTKVVTLTSGLSAAASSGATVTCPYYNAMLGAGWACLTTTNQRGVTAGWTTNEITITNDAVLNFETFKCAIKDTDTSAGNASANKVVCDIISFTDMSDPITVDLVSQKGFTIKNNGNDVDAKAVAKKVSHCFESVLVSLVLTLA